eukprot:4360890-Ditylum_brightwellii.AAC.1
MRAKLTTTDRQRDRHRDNNKGSGSDCPFFQSCQKLTTPERQRDRETDDDNEIPPPDHPPRIGLAVQL